MSNLNIPIYRAKKIDSDEYVEGYLIENEQGAFIIKKMTVLPISNKLYTQIDRTTLAIHFPDMLDSQGNKIFASLSKDGKGASIIEGDCTIKNFPFSMKDIYIYKENYKQCKAIGIQK